jgi:hypothetical protein
VCQCLDHWPKLCRRTHRGRQFGISVGGHGPCFWEEGGPAEFDGGSGCGGLLMMLGESPPARSCCRSRSCHVESACWSFACLMSPRCPATTDKSTIS